MKNAISNAVGLSGSKTGLGSSSNTTFLTPVSVKGGVVRNIDNATGDIARTTSGWIEDEKYGFYTGSITDAVSAEFDSSVTRTGRLTLKLSTTNTLGKIRASHSIQSGSTNTTYADLHRLIDAKPNTAYKLSCYVKTTNVAASSAFIYLAEYNGITWVKDTSSSKLTGTNDWTLLTASVTTGATTDKLKFVFFLNIAGNISDAWFDVNSMTLEEVTTVTNSYASNALLYPTVTAVTSNDNIDQNQLTIVGTIKLGDGTIQKDAQSFTPTKKNYTGFVFQKKANTGSPAFDVTMSIQADVAGSPSGIDLGTPVLITASQWDAKANDTDYVVNYPLTVTPATSYWIIATPSAQGDASNYRNISLSGATNPYTAGGIKKWNGSAWSSLDIQYDLYFKTLYAKNTTNLTVRTDTEEISVTSPTIDGWEDGTVVGFDTPLTLASGVNNIYLSANGFDSGADGAVDSSLQGIFGGNYAN